MFRTRTQHGQSIVFMAFFILILIAFVGLSIDTGKAMAQQRKIQAGSNASSIAGMNVVAKKYDDEAVLAAIKSSLESNQITKYQQVMSDEELKIRGDSDTIYFRAQYLDKAGAPITGDIGTLPATIPYNRGVFFVQVKTSVDVQNQFASVLGVSTYNVNAMGVASFVACNSGIYPMTFHKRYLEKDTSANPRRDYQVVPYPDGRDAPASEFPPDSIIDANRFPANTGGSGNFYWLRWFASASGGSGSQQTLGDAMTGPGTFSDGFQEATPPTGDYNGDNPGALDAHDWIAGDSGNPNILRTQLDYHIANRTLMLIPIHDAVVGSGLNVKYRTSELIAVRLLHYNLNGQNSTFTFGLVERNYKCIGPSTPRFDPFTLKVDFEQNVLWKERTTNINSFDIAIVQDYSASMAYKWDSNGSYVGFPERRIDKAIPVINDFVKEMLVTRKLADPQSSNEIAYVTFGHKNSSGVHSAQMDVNFTNDPTKFASVTGYNPAATSANPTANSTKPGYQFPSGVLTGQTNTAAGLQQALTLLSRPPRIGPDGRPVKLKILLITDGLANVLPGDLGPRSNKVNSMTLAPYRCGNPGATETQNLDDPFIQSTCPIVGGVNKSPIQATVDVANQAKANGISISVILLGRHSNPNDMQLGLIADNPNSFDYADSPAAFANMVQSVIQEWTLGCIDRSNRTVMANTRFTIIDTTNTSVTYPVQTDSNGHFEYKNFPAGSYKITVSTNLTGGDGVSRLYNRLTSPEQGTADTNLPFTMPSDSSYTVPGPVVLQIADSQLTAVQCSTTP